MINRQICQSVVAEIKYELSCANISTQNETEAKATLNATLSEISFGKIKAIQESKFQDVLANNDYNGILRVFNEKQISQGVGHFMGLDKRAYPQTVINLLRGRCKDKITAALVPFLPPEIHIG